MKTVSVDTIQGWLLTNLTEQLGIGPQDIDIRKPVTEYGLDSITGVSLAGDLEDWLRLQLSPTVLWDYPTIESLALHLAEESDRGSEQHDLSHIDQARDGDDMLSQEYAEQLLAKLDELSDEDVDSLLDGLLAA